MYDATPVRTYQPVIPAGVGPICERPEDALLDILRDINETATSGVQLTEDVLDSVAIMLGRVMSDWFDGEYTIFEDYQLIIKTYTRTQIDEMPEWNGY